jgi:hypothetical protein
VIRLEEPERLTNGHERAVKWNSFSHDAMFEAKARITGIWASTELPAGDWEDRLRCAQ